MKENTQLPLVAAYHNNAVDKEQELTAQAYRDLHVEDFFAFADHTASYIGKQYLYHLLRQDSQSEVWEQEALLDRMSRETGWPSVPRCSRHWPKAVRRCWSPRTTWNCTDTWPANTSRSTSASKSGTSGCSSTTGSGKERPPRKMPLSCCNSMATTGR